MKIKVSKQEDWQNLSKQGLNVVVDPMVFRCGEVFLKGVKEALIPLETHQLLMNNVHALAMFFDSIILNEKMPVFNYGDTFDSMLNFDERTLTRINEYEHVLYEIDIDHAPYHEVKTAALDELLRLYKGPNKIKESMASDIIKELSVLGYSWNPSIGLGSGLNPSIEDLANELLSETEKTLAAYLLGGLIFGGYAQQMETEHVLQPKRSRILSALSVGSDSAAFRHEDQIFDELKARANTPSEDLPWMPTFFPYLLSKSDSPLAMLQEVVKLRSSTEIREYRQWLREVIDDFKTNGRISIQKTKDVRSIARHIDRILGTVSSAPKVELKASVIDVVAGKIPGGVDLTPGFERLWGWFLQNLPGRRYRKILTRATIADHEYKNLDARITKVWRQG
jgi:hypothetical protein